MELTQKENPAITTDNSGSLFKYALHLADNSLIMGQRLSEWTAHGPTLEQDIAISNIALDLIGQSRNFYQYAAQIKGDGATEDTLAYFRDAPHFLNNTLAELPNADWAFTVLKLYFFSTYQFLLYSKLQTSNDKQIAAIAEKSLKEVTYHKRWSGEWVVRLGDGTDESHKRMIKALDELHPYISTLFISSTFEQDLSQNIAVNVEDLKKDWLGIINDTLTEATIPTSKDFISNTLDGKRGEHTEYLQSLLKEMQQLQRALPGCEW
ncbi:MAG: phenylacetate-CoA oxygenase subunit PaaC [Ginsengibacter sp.]